MSIECERYGLVQTVAPTLEPVLWTDMVGGPQTWGRDPATEEKATVELLITAAREKAESYTGLQLIQATYALSLDGFPGWTIEIPKNPLAISSVAYTDINGASQTVAAADYRFHAATGRLEPAFGESWPVARAMVGSVVITFTAGYGSTAATVPAEIRVAIRALVLDWLEGRVMRFDVPLGFTRALEDFRLGREWG